VWSPGLPGGFDEEGTTPGPSEVAGISPMGAKIGLSAVALDSLPPLPLRGGRSFAPPANVILVSAYGDERDRDRWTGINSKFESLQFGRLRKEI
jgi:hypothetical protein